MAARRKFYPLSDDESRLMEDVLGAGESIIAHLDSTELEKPDRFWTVLLERLLALASFGPRLLYPYSRDVSRRAKRRYEELGPTTEHFFDRLHMLIARLGKDVCSLIDAYPEEGFHCECENAKLISMDLAELANDFEGFIAGWRSGDPEIRAETEWDLRYGYEIHWGEHLHRALWTTQQMVCAAKLD